MPKLQIDKLVYLINSMTKAEKRSFRLYANRNANASDSLFMQLFDFIAKEGHCDEKAILIKIPKLKKSQISNLKANLFKQILTGLRLTDRNKFEEINVREQIDFAKILYERGMYKTCLEVLDKAKKRAIEINYETLALSILYFEKRIESQHVTGSMAATADRLAIQSNCLLEEIGITNKLSNASLLLYGEYLKHGYVKSAEDFERLKLFFKAQIPEVQIQTLSFYQKLYYFQSHVWYYNMGQDFVNYYKYALRWVELFIEDPSKQELATTPFIKGYHNLLNALFMTGRRDKFNEALQKFDALDILSKSNVSENERSLFHLVKSVHLLNFIFVNAAYNEPTQSFLEFEKVLNTNAYNWDPHRLLVFNYKMGCVYFGMGQLDKAILYLNKVADAYKPGFREDIQSFARILNLIVHFDLGNESLVSYQVKSLYRFLSKLSELQKVQLEIIKFLRRTPKMMAQNMNSEFQSLKDKLEHIETEPFEKRPFLYLDIISWLNSKIKGVSMKAAIQDKLLK